MGGSEDVKWLGSEVTVALIFGLIACLYTAYRYITGNNDYFTKRNVPYIKPTFFFGSVKSLVLRRTSLCDHVIAVYNQLDGHKIAGMFDFLRPSYVVRDPELIKYITVKDFDHFVDVPIIIPEDAEPILTKGLQSLKGQKWKDMRSTLSPAFTSSKMKILFTVVSETGQQLTTHLENCYRQQQATAKHESMSEPSDVLSLELKELFTKYTNDVIATAAFGIQCNTLENPDNEFYKMGKEFNNISLLRIIIFIAYSYIPKVMKMLGARLVPKKTADFFRTLVRETIKFREQEGIIRPDMIHLLMQVRQDNLWEDGSSSDVNLESQNTSTQDITRSTKISLDTDDIAAQALVFFSAGFEAVATLLSFSTLLLAVHQDIQNQAREEVDKVLAEHGGQVTYEAVQSIKYLDNILSETLRIYPPAPLISRKCVKEYQVPGSDLKIEKDSSVMVPIVGLHYDSNYFPNPETFNPDRFSEDNKHSIQPFTYMPFGSGPRHCIANRFALMETKTALVHLLSHFELHTTSKTQLPLRLVKGLKMAPEGDFWCGFKLRKPISNVTSSEHD
ncbi:Cytochrome P450 9e2 [Cryptotermes secundus]|uniref:Cytochrome P450 9e2 n=2 Tax=Cryptotermes secundus TaxID=105785 RepID=A0A2J7RCC6_9NEOP|nr:Cytochrome P450 9e2 [Cryptotermes secundus]